MLNEELALDARAIDWGHDRTLNRAMLRLDVGRRIASAEAFDDFVRSVRG